MNIKFEKGIILLLPFLVLIISLIYHVIQNEKEIEQEIGLSKEKSETEEQKDKKVKNNSQQLYTNKVPSNEQSGANFVLYGEEWLENNIGITLHNVEYTLHPEELEDDIYHNTDNWQLGNIQDSTDSIVGSPGGYYFVTMTITNYNNEPVELREEDNIAVHSFMLFGIEKGGYCVKESGSLVFATYNKGNKGDALHDFGNFEIKANETVEVTYGFGIVYTNPDELDWYLGDSRLSLEVDIREKSNAVLMCIEKEERIP